MPANWRYDRPVLLHLRLNHARYILRSILETLLSVETPKCMEQYIMNLSK